MQPKQEVPNIAPLVEYHFESYKDQDNENIKFRVIDNHGCSYEIRKGEEVERYGTTFKLSANGALDITHTTCEYQPKIKVSGIDIVNLQGQNFKKLDIKANTVNFYEDCAVANLKVSANKITNHGLLNTKNAELKAEQIKNYKIIQAANNIKLESTLLINHKGGLHAGNSLTVDTYSLFSKFGSISGVKNTTVNIDGYLSNNQASHIGVGSSNTEIIFGPYGSCLYDLGNIAGKKVKIINAPIVTQEGVITASEVVELTNNEMPIIMPNVDINTPLLNLATANFHLKEQTNCQRTVFKINDFKTIKLTHEYRTKGVFVFQEQGVNHENIKQIMLDRFGAIEQYNKENLPDAKYNISIQATIQADQGISALAPNAKLSVGTNGASSHPELLAQSGNLTTYVTEFAIEKGGAAAKNAFIWAPRGFPLGRLIEDPSRQAFATFYAHAHNCYSHNLGGDIQQNDYTFLDHNIQAYDGRHLLIMPIAISNGSFLQIKELTKIVGPCNNQGYLQTHHLKIDSTSAPSVWEGGVGEVSGDGELLGNLHLKRTTTNFNGTYYTHPAGWDYNARIGGTISYNFCNSDPSQLYIAGKLFGNAVIQNEASYLHAEEKAPEVQVDSKDFIASLYQQFIRGTIQEQQELIDSVGSTVRINHYGQSVDAGRILNRGNGMHDNGCIPYGAGFLAKTNNFAGAQNVFPAQTSFNAEVVLPCNRPDNRLDGMIAAPKLLVTVANGHVEVGIPNPYYINPKNPFRDLTRQYFNPHTTYYMPEQMKQLITDAVKPKFYFMFRERFWFDEQQSQKFYKDILDDIVIRKTNGEFAKPQLQAIFSLSPKFLIDRIKEECQEVLMRGYIYEGRAINAEFIKGLHKNATEYLKANNISLENLHQALIAANSHQLSISLPTKPIIYYQIFITDQGLEVLLPCLYIPVDLINEVRAQRGGLVKTNTFLMFPEHLTPKELIAITEDRPVLQNFLVNFFDNNPKERLFLHNNALMKKEQLEHNQLTVPTVPNNNLQSSATINSTIQANKLATILEQDITINGQLATEDTLLASLFQDVAIRSHAVRVGNSENFDDIIVQARVAAKNLLQIFAGRNSIFEKAETVSGEAGTYIQALANILDLPVGLVSQRVQHFCEERKSGYTKDTYVTQSTSTHKSEGNFNALAGNTSIYYSPAIEAKQVNMTSISGPTVVNDVTDTYEHQEDIRSKKNRIYGGYKKTHKQSCSGRATSRGARINAKKWNVASIENNVEVRNVQSTARNNLFSAKKGKVSILQGVNKRGSVNVSTSSEPLWQKQSSKQENHTTYSASTFTGTIEIDAKSAEIEVVCDQILNFLEQITLKPDDTIYKILYEHHEAHAESKEGPGVALIALVALVATIATHGMASGWSTALLSGTASGSMHAALTAGFQSIMAQAASTFVANNGDIKKALKDLCKEDTLKKIATSILSAGIMDKVTTGLDLPKEAINRSMPENMAHNVTKATVDAGLASGISGKNFDKTLQENLINAAFTTLSNKIDLLNISEGDNTLLHAMLGGVRGTVNKDGWLAGMVESLVSAKLPGYVQNLQKKKSAQGKVKATKFRNNKAVLTRIQEQKLLEQEQLLLQKEELKQKIYSKLSIFVRVQAQAGKNVDFSTMLATINKVVDTSDVTQLQELGQKFDNLFNINAEQPIVTTISKDNLHGASSPELVLTWWERLKENYVKVTTEDNALESVVNEQQSKAILNAYKSLSSKFSKTDWRPLQSASSGVKKHTVGIGKDKKGRIHNRDLSSGKFSKSAFEKAKNSLQQGELNTPTIDSSATQGLADKTQCWKADLARTTAQDNPEIQTGFRAYVCDATSSSVNVTKEGVNIEGSIGGNVGTNLASGSANSNLGASELQVSGPSASLQAEGNLATDKQVASIGLKADVKFTLGGVSSQYTSGKWCPNNKCCSAQLNAALEFGAGCSIGGSYKHNTSKKSDNISVTAGLGVGILPTLGLKVDCEPKTISQEDLTAQQNNATFPKPSL